VDIVGIEKFSFLEIGYVSYSTFNLKLIFYKTLTSIMRITFKQKNEIVLEIYHILQ
jgi:hypothetical protein